MCKTYDFCNVFDFRNFNCHQKLAVKPSVNHWKFSFLHVQLIKSQFYCKPVFFLHFQNLSFFWTLFWARDEWRFVSTNLIYEWPDDLAHCLWNHQKDHCSSHSGFPLDRLLYTNRCFRRSPNPKRPTVPLLRNEAGTTPPRPRNCPTHCGHSRCCSFENHRWWNFPRALRTAEVDSMLLATDHSRSSNAHDGTCCAAEGRGRSHHCCHCCCRHCCCCLCCHCLGNHLCFDAGATRGKKHGR